MRNNKYEQPYSSQTRPDRLSPPVIGRSEEQWGAWSWSGPGLGQGQAE